MMNRWDRHAGDKSAEPGRTIPEPAGSLRPCRSGLGLLAGMIVLGLALSGCATRRDEVRAAYRSGGDGLSPAVGRSAVLRCRNRPERA